MKLAFVAALSFALVSTNSPALAQPTPPAPDVGPLVASDNYMGTDTYRLWTGRAEGARGDGTAETPTITVFRPFFHFGEKQVPRPAIIVAPGGAYRMRAVALEGREVADWFSVRGVTPFVLNYRTGALARLPIPLSDGRRAVQFVRANAARLGVDPQRIGMIGFSAGGHLSAMTAAQAVDGKPDAKDPLDRVSSRPDFLVLGYPWLEGTAVDAEGRSQYCTFTGAACNPRDYEGYQPLRFVSERMPPTFIYHTTADSLVPAMGSLRFYEALNAKRVPVELHVFGPGEHGTGLGGRDPALSHWPELLESWMRGRNLLNPGPAQARP